MPGKTIGNALLLILTLVIACTWAFPIYWAIVTSIKPEQDVVNKTTLIPDVLNFSGYYYALFETKLSKEIPNFFGELKQAANPNVLLKGPPSDREVIQGNLNLIQQAGGPPPGVAPKK